MYMNANVARKGDLEGECIECLRCRDLEFCIYVPIRFPTVTRKIACLVAGYRYLKREKTFNNFDCCLPGTAKEDPLFKRYVSNFDGANYLRKFVLNDYILQGNVVGL